MPDRDRIGQRKVRLMAVWVGVGIPLIVLGLFTSPWISLLGACIIGATPVYFTLRGALAAPRQASTPTAPRAPSGEHRRYPARRRGHTGDERRPSE
jgi:hypothetical protein